MVKQVLIKKFSYLGVQVTMHTYKHNFKLKGQFVLILIEMEAAVKFWLK